MKMDNKRVEIEAILKDLYYSVTVDKAKLTPRVVYSYLTKRNVPKNDLEKNFNRIGVSDNSDTEENFFGKWIDEFNNVENINVFCSIYWRYFCQFKNCDLVDNNNKDYVKVYIPLDYNHIYEGVKIIFTFLAESNIKHVSKVCSNIRFDDVVVRLNNLEDARKLQAFIDNNRYIQEGFIKPNPFAFSKNGVSYAFDSSLSYNFYIASLIDDYIKKISKDTGKTINDVNLSSFYSYIDYISSNVSEIKRILKFKYEDDANDSNKVIDAYFVVDLLKKSLVSNNLNDYDQAYLNFCNVDRKRGISNIVSDEKNSSKESLFQECILAMMKKYPLGSDPKHPNISGVDYIFSYLKGSKIAITRDNNLRERVSSELSIQDIYDIVSYSGIFGNNIKEKINNYIKMVMLNEIISCMSIRMGNNMISNINEFIRTNDSLYITNKVGNARILAYTFSGTDMRIFLANLGVRGIEEYISKYYRDSNNNGRGVNL